MSSFVAATTSSNCVVGGGEGADEDLLLPSELKLTRTETCDADFTCPYSGTLLEQPCTLSCGHTYSRSSLAHLITQGNRRCPIAGLLPTTGQLASLRTPTVKLSCEHEFTKVAIEEAIARGDSKCPVCGPNTIPKSGALVAANKLLNKLLTRIIRWNAPQFITDLGERSNSEMVTFALPITDSIKHENVVKTLATNRGVQKQALPVLQPRVVTLQCGCSFLRNVLRALIECGKRDCPTCHRRNALPPTAEGLHVDLVLSRLLRRLFRTRAVEPIVYGKHELEVIEAEEGEEEVDTTRGFMPPTDMKTGFDVMVHRSRSPPPAPLLRSKEEPPSPGSNFHSLVSLLKLQLEESGLSDDELDEVHHGSSNGQPTDMLGGYLAEPGLVELDLSMRMLGIHRTALNQLNAGLKTHHWKRLKSLNLRDNLLGAFEVQELFKGVHGDSLAELTSLDVANNPMGDFAVELLLDALAPVLPHWTDLDLTGTVLSYQGLAKLTAILSGGGFKKLEVLRLSRNILATPGGKSDAGVAFMRALEGKNAAACLRVLDMSFTKIGADSVGVLAEVIASCPNLGQLEELDLTGCQVAGAVLSKLLTAITFSKACESMRALELAKNGITGLDLVEALASMRRQPKTPSASISWPGLHVLNLAANDIDAGGTKALAQALESGIFPSLDKLILIKNPQLGPAGAEALAVALEQGRAPLSLLDVSSCAVGDHGAHAFGRLLKSGKVPSLHHLGLNSDDIGDHGALEVAEALLSHSCPPHLRISLLGNPAVTSIGRIALEDASAGKRRGGDARAIAVTEKNMLDRQPSHEG